VTRRSSPQPPRQKALIRLRPAANCRLNISVTFHACYS